MEFYKDQKRLPAHLHTPYVNNLDQHSADVTDSQIMVLSMMREESVSSDSESDCSEFDICTDCDERINIYLAREMRLSSNNITAITRKNSSGEQLERPRAHQ